MINLMTKDPWFIEENRRKGTGNTTHTQLDMHGISPVICSQAGVASIYLFPKQIFFERAYYSYPCAGIRNLYMGRNSVSCNICYLASYVTFSVIQHVIY